MKRVLIALVSLFVFTVIVFAAYGAYFFATLIIHINNAADCLPQELKMARQASMPIQVIFNRHCLRRG